MFRAVCDDNGRRWRVEGPGWTMQPEGTVSAAEAEEICRASAHALTLNEAVEDAAFAETFAECLAERVGDVVLYVPSEPEIEAACVAFHGSAEEWFHWRAGRRPAEAEAFRAGMAKAIAAAAVN